MFKNKEIICEIIKNNLYFKYFFMDKTVILFIMLCCIKVSFAYYFKFNYFHLHIFTLQIFSLHIFSLNFGILLRDLEKCIFLNKIT